MRGNKYQRNMLCNFKLSVYIHSWTRSPFIMWTVIEIYRKEIVIYTYIYIALYMNTIRIFSSSIFIGLKIIGPPKKRFSWLCFKSFFDIAQEIRFPGDLQVALRVRLNDYVMEMSIVAWKYWKLTDISTPITNYN